jgi:tRNA threonylcarbamoyladenosine biosynthesis protein TsaE
MRKSNKIVYSTSSPDETLQLGMELGGLVEPGDILCLHGDLGAGKTHLVKGIARGLGVSEHLVNSPTFTLIHEYPGKLPIYHLDLYRIEHAEELREIGVEEYLFGAGVSIIEWPDLIENDLPTNAVHVFIRKTAVDTRTFELVYPGNT